MNKKLFGAGAALVVLGLVLLGIVAVNRPDSDDAGTGNATPQTQQTTSPQTTGSQAQTPSSNSTATNSDATATAVTIQDMAFSPATLTIKKGTAVTWTNKDSVKHTVTMDNGQSGGPDSELLGTGEQYSMTFTTTGTYTYHCAPHPNMKATVIVTE